MLFIFLYPILSHVSYVVTLLINCNVVASINTLCQVLQMFHYYSTMYTIFRVVLARHPQTSKWSCPFSFYGVAAVLGPNILWSTPLIKTSTIKLTQIVVYCCIMFFYQLTAILVISLLNITAKAQVIIEILQGHFIRKFLHFL